MRVLLASEAHFERVPGGSVFTRGPEDYTFWSSYNSQDADEVGVLARLRPVASASPGAQRADGPGVCFYALDDYRGPWQYLSRLPRLRRQARDAVAGYDFFVLRAPGAVAYLAWSAIREVGRPFAVEVLGDPWESLAPGRVSGLLREPARRWSRRRLERLCREASAVRYVTRFALQQRYAARSSRIFAFSDAGVEPAASGSLDDRFARIENHRPGDPWRLGFAGSLETLAKAPDVLLRAVRLLLDCGTRLGLVIAGDGRYRPDLEHLAAHLDLCDVVRFLGAVPHAALTQFLDGIDLFVLPSHTEGLPRALVEAIARGCPAIASKAGGIPELLDAADLFDPVDPPHLAQKLAEVLEDPARLDSMARRNFATGRAFGSDALAPVRRRYLRELRLITEEEAR